jgi:hypothetical protein
MIVGMNVSLRSEDRYYPALAGQVEVEKKAAIRARYRGTSTFLVERGRGTTHRFKPVSLTNPTPYNQAIEYALRIGRKT